MILESTTAWRFFSLLLVLGKGSFNHSFYVCPMETRTLLAVPCMPFF